MDSTTNIAWPDEFTEAFEQAVDIFELSEGEKAFVLTVFSRLEALAEGICVRAKNLWRFRKAHALYTGDPDPRSFKDDLLVGLDNQPSPGVILQAIRFIVRASFPAGTIDYTLRVFD